MPKIAYPCDFNGLTGARCTADIEHREGFLYVPFKMLLSVGKAMNHPVVGKIIQENPHLFSK